MNDGFDTPVLKLDWDEQAVWVQDRTMYLLVEGEDPDAPMINVQDQAGQTMAVLRAELEKTHAPLHNATIYKSRYAPIQAFCPRQTVVLQLDGETIEVASGDAVLREREGRISVMPRHEFNCRYQFVSAAAEKAPFT